MGFEIDFLAVGDTGSDGKQTRSGDAIMLRWGNLFGGRYEQQVAIVDGGCTPTGERLVEEIRNRYGTSEVDFVICSHPHADHIRGLFPVLENLKVHNLLLHKPWEHGQAVVDSSADGRLSYRGTSTALKECFECAWELNKTATRKGIPVTEPFEGVQSTDGSLVVLGPSAALYRELLAANQAEKDVAGPGGLLAAIMEGIAKGKRVLAEVWDSDALAEPRSDAVEPQNHTSTIIHLNLGPATALLTADAGVLALDRAASFAESRGLDLRRCTYVQVPHHGSKRNVGPAVLDRILGPILPPGTPPTRSGMLSAAKDGEPKHPSGRVTNAFFRRGVGVAGTQGRDLRWSKDAPVRPTWEPVQPIPFRSSFDESDD